MKTVLYNEAKYVGGSAKNRCEDFVNCLDGSESGFYSGDNGASSGILSLDYDSKANLIYTLKDIIEDLIPKKRKALEELSSTIHGGWFSSGLIYCSFSLENELAESKNQLKKEESGLKALLTSFEWYVTNVAALEEGVCRGLSKIKDLEATAVSAKNINNIDASVNLGSYGKISKTAKSFFIDVVGGTMYAVQGGEMAVESFLITPVQPEVGVPGMVFGGTACISGGNTAINGVADLKHELNGEWGEIGDTNVVKTLMSKMATNISGDEESGTSFGNDAMFVIDTVGAIKGFKDLTKIPNDIKFRNGKIIDLGYTPPKITPAIASGTFDFKSYSTIVGSAHSVECDYYTGKTILDDGNAILNESVTVVNESDSVNTKIVAAWLED